MGGKMSQLVPGLFVGGLRNAEDEEDLAANKITHVLSIIHHDSPIKNKSANRTYHGIVAFDTPETDISTFFTEASIFIHQARVEGGSCLVHCMMGISRSVTLCVAYLTTITGLHHNQVLQSVKGHREVASPNQGFIVQLEDWYNNGRWKSDQELLISRFGPWMEVHLDVAVLEKGMEKCKVMEGAGDGSVD